MSGLREYLLLKRQAVFVRRMRAQEAASPSIEMTATVVVEGLSGVRRVTVRGFQLLSDSLPDYAGFDLGPSSPELLLGVLGSCVAHTFLIRAAESEIPLDSLEVEVDGIGDLRTGFSEFPGAPVGMTGLAYRVNLSSPADEATLAALHQRVRETCPVLDLITRPQQVQGELRHSS